MIKWLVFAKVVGIVLVGMAVGAALITVALVMPR
jgi:hypothetical protein